jgi:hypothetical protein
MYDTHILSIVALIIPPGNLWSVTVRKRVQLRGKDEAKTGEDASASALQGGLRTEGDRGTQRR